MIIVIHHAKEAKPVVAFWRPDATLRGAYNAERLAQIHRAVNCLNLQR